MAEFSLGTLSSPCVSWTALLLRLLPMVICCRRKKVTTAMPPTTPSQVELSTTGGQQKSWSSAEATRPEEASLSPRASSQVMFPAPRSSLVSRLRGEQTVIRGMAESWVNRLLARSRIREVDQSMSAQQTTFKI